MDVQRAETTRPIDSRLDELLLAWEESRAAGTTLAPDELYRELCRELCRDAPELAVDLAREIERLQALDRFMGGATDWEFSATPRAPGKDFGDSPVFPGYELLEQIGHGGMGVVYKARQQNLSRIVAIKTLAGNRWGQPACVARLRQEAQALSRMKHRHVVQVYDIIETPHAVSLVLEYVDGESLARRRNGAALSPSEAVPIAITLAETLGAVHAEGLLHRDIKPANVLISCSGEVKISDFGLAKDAGAADGLTATGDILGSPGYMAPEQAEARTAAIDVRTDVYALGATLYEMLTGRPPFVGDSVVATLDLVRHSEPVPLRLLNPGVPRDLETITLRCLEKDPARRFPTAHELGEELGRYLRGEPIRSRPIAAFHRALRWCRRRPAIALLTGLATAAAIVSVALFVARQRDLTEYNRRLTSANRQLERSAASAVRLQRIAQDNERHANDALYAADMSRAAAAWRDEDTRAFTQLLERHVPRGDEPDRRGFEWWYLRRQAHLARRTLLETAFPQYVVAYCPAGRHVASAGADSVLRILDAETGALALEVPTGQIEINGIAFAPDCAEIATAGDDGTIRIWDRASGAARRTWKAHPKKAFQLLYTPDGSRIISCGDHPQIRVFDAISGERVQSLDAHENDVQSLVLTPDGTRLVSVGDDCTARIWDLARGTAVQQFASSSRVVPVAIVPERHLLIIGNDAGLLQTVDLRDNREIGVVKHFDKLGAMALHPGGTLIAAGDRSGKIRMRRIDSDGHFDADRFLPWQAHAGNVFSLAWSHDGSRLVSAGEDGRVVSWSLAAILRESGPDSIRVESADSFCLIPGTTSLLTVSRFPQTLSRWDWSARKREAQFSGLARQQPGAELRDVRVSPDGKRVAFRQDPGTLHVFALDRVFGAPSPEASLAALTPGGALRAPVFSYDSKTVALPVHRVVPGGRPPDYHACRFAAPDFRSTAPIPIRGVNTLAFAQEGGRLALSNDGGIILWDLVRDARIWEMPQIEVSRLVVSPDGALLAGGGANRLVVIRRLSDGLVLHQLEGHHAPVTCIAFSPDQATLATAASDGAIKLWHVATGQELFELKTAAGSCRDIEFASGGRHLLALVTGTPFASSSAGDEILIFSAAQHEDGSKRAD